MLIIPQYAREKYNRMSISSVQFTQSCPTLHPMDCSMPGFPAHHQLPEPIQTHVHWVHDAIQPSYLLLSPSPPAFNLAQHQGLFQWVSSSHQVVKILDFQHQSFQWIFRVSCHQYSSVAQLCLTLCDSMDYSTSGFAVHHQLPELAQTHVHQLSEAIQPSHSVIPFSSCLQSFPASGSFPMSQLFTSGGQSIGVSASTSVLPMNTQDWSPLEWTGWISLQAKGLSRVFSDTTIQKHQFFHAQPS